MTPAEQTTECLLPFYTIMKYVKSIRIAPPPARTQLGGDKRGVQKEGCYFTV
jgi:hypothetical protein